MTNWQFATVLEAITDTIGDKPALICGDVTRSWREYDDRSARLATVLTDYGLGLGSKVGIYLHNSNEYLEAHHAVMKFRGCPINVNYRYEQDELVYLLNNADTEALVFQAAYASRINDIRDRLDQVKYFIQVDDGSDQPLIEGALDFEAAIAAAQPMPRIERSSDDLYMLYTGGTTGLPKGVMYNGGYHCGLLIDANAGLGGYDAPKNIDQLVARVAAAAENDNLDIGLICCPLMHGTGMWTGTMRTQVIGGTVVTVNQLGFDADRLWQAAEKHRATSLTIVGDAMARPLLEALDRAKENGTPYDISSVSLMASSGVMWSKEVKEGLLKHHDMTLFDAMGSTEGGMAVSMSNRALPPTTAKFQLSDTSRVFTDDDREVQPGSDEMGMVATLNDMLGYYKDPEKTAKTIRIIDDKRWVFPGDYAKVREDGTIELLGRGSMCINTAGEKVFPEEVEEALKTHEYVEDCLVVGVPDERFGHKVAAVVALTSTSINESQLIEHCRGKIAGYKLPKHVLVVDQVKRAPNGKPDYGWAKETSTSLLGLADTK